MSSLQKFHRRTNNAPIAVTWPATAIGGGDDTYGYWMGDVSTNKIIIAPKSTEFKAKWGSYNVVRGTTSRTNGLANTNTLYAFGGSLASGHPAAYGCKILTTGGYNTWYLPATDELLAVYSNKSATPFATANACNTVSRLINYTDVQAYWVSTEGRSVGSTSMNEVGMYASAISFTSGISSNYAYGNMSKNDNISVRAIRRTAI